MKCQSVTRILANFISDRQQAYEAINKKFFLSSDINQPISNNSFVEFDIMKLQRIEQQIIFSQITQKYACCLTIKQPPYISSSDRAFESYHARSYMRKTIPFPAAIPNKIPSIPNHFSYSSLFPITKPLSTEFESPQANPTCLRFNHPKPTYNEFRPLFIANPQFYSEMNYSCDLWEMQPSEYSIGSIDFFYQPDSRQSALRIHQNSYFPKIETLELDLHPKTDNTSKLTEPEPKEAVALPTIKQSINKRGTVEGLYREQKTRRKKKFKPSPYHNYQKHLNTTLKHLIVFPPNDSFAPEPNQIASQLWSIFLVNESAPKKILHFIFNQFNQYRIKVEELQQFGFDDIYSRCSRQLLSQAKNYLTNVAISQLNDQNIDNYLATRRIKNPLKFKRYLLLFKKELQDGFLKKRFTNRSRKEQMRREIIKNS